MTPDDTDIDALLAAWATRTRLSDSEVSTMLSAVAEADAPDHFTGESAHQWLAFWQQIGQLIRTERASAGRFLGIAGSF